MRALLRRLAGTKRLPGGALLIHPDNAAAVLLALEDASEYRSDEFARCLDCPADRPCDDHAADLDAARTFDTLYARLTGQRR